MFAVTCNCLTNVAKDETKFFLLHGWRLFQMHIKIKMISTWEVIGNPNGDRDSSGFTPPCALDDIELFDVTSRPREQKNKTCVLGLVSRLLVSFGILFWWHFILVLITLWNNVFKFQWRCTLYCFQNMFNIFWCHIFIYMILMDYHVQTFKLPSNVVVFLFYNSYDYHVHCLMCLMSIVYEHNEILLKFSYIF